MRSRLAISWRAILLVRCALSGHRVEGLYGGGMRCLTCYPYRKRISRDVPKGDST